MAKVRIELDRGGVHELLNSQVMADLMTEYGQNHAHRAGEGYAAAPPHKSGQRVIVNVYAATEEARRDNLENNTLLKTMKGGAT